MRWLLLSVVALVGCGPPTVSGLRAELDEDQPVGALRQLAEACDGHETSSACRILKAELCGKDAKAARARAAAAVARHRLFEASAVPDERPQACPKDTGLGRIAAIAAALDTCDRAGDDHCALKVVLAADPEVVPELAEWHARQHGWICGARLAAAPEPPTAAALLSTLRWCTPAQRADLKQRTLAALAQGLPTPQQATQACARLERVLPADAAVAEACDHIATTLATTLQRAADAAGEAGAPGAALVLAERAAQLGQPVAAPTRQAWAARLDRLARARLSWTATAADAPGTALLGQVAQALSANPPQGFVWHADDADVQLDAALPEPWQPVEQRSTTFGQHRYVSHHRDVVNPEWALADEACRRAERRHRRCAREHAAERREHDSCARRKRDAQADYERCERARATGQRSLSCRRPNVTCHQTVRRCSKRRMRQTCNEADALPRTVPEPVWAVHRYPIETVRRRVQLTLKSRARPSKGRPHAGSQALSVAVEDAHHAGAPAVGLAPDPLKLPGQADLVAHMAQQAVAAVQGVLAQVRGDRCAGWREARRAAEAEQALRRVVEIDQRRVLGGCKPPPAEVEAATQALLRTL